MTLAADSKPTAGQAGASSTPAQALRIIDCDVHAGVNGIDDLMPYLPQPWQRYVRDSGFKGPPGTVYPKVKPYAARNDAHPPSGRLPGTDLGFLQQQHLDAWKIDRAVLTPLYYVGGFPNVDLAAALCAAHNDYIIEHWCRKDERIYSSILVPWGDTDLSIREIERVGDHPQVVQVLLSVASGELYGKRRFHPLWRAVADKGLRLAIHFGGLHVPDATGHPSYYLEHHTNQTQAFMAQLTSLVVEGVFERIPDLKIILLEGGLGWVPSLMWRLDKNWKGCRMEVPWLKRRPSDYIRQHVRLSTQPIEEPDDPRHLVQVLEHLGSDEMVVFATDYPHWDFDAPDRALPRQIKGTLREKIMAGKPRLCITPSAAAKCHVKPRATPRGIRPQAELVLLRPASLPGRAISSRAASRPVSGRSGTGPTRPGSL